MFSKGVGLTSYPVLMAFPTHTAQGFPSMLKGSPVVVCDIGFKWVIQSLEYGKFVEWSKKCGCVILPYPLLHLKS